MYDVITFFAFLLMVLSPCIAAYRVKTDGEG